MKNLFSITILLVALFIISCKKDDSEKVPCSSSLLNEDYIAKNNLYVLQGTWVSDKNPKDTLYIHGDKIRTNIVIEQVFVEDTPMDVHVIYYYNLVNGELRLSQNDDFSKVFKGYVCVYYTLKVNQLSIQDFKVPSENLVIKNTNFTRIN